MRKKCVLCILIVLIIVIGGYAGNEGKGEVLTLEELKEIYETEMGMEIFSFRG